MWERERNEWVKLRERERGRERLDHSQQYSKEVCMCGREGVCVCKRECVRV